MAKLGDIRQAAITRLKQCGLPDSARDVDFLLEDGMGISPLDILTAPDQEIPPAVADRFDHLLARRMKREPVSQILGQRDFWTLRFKVTGDCLTPRPDSETLIDAALRALPDRKAPLDIVDFGTGSGCLLLSLLSEYPQSRGTAVDLSEKALAVAQENARALEFSNRCDFILSDWDANMELARKFDVILCNPPYIALQEAPDLEADVRDYEPHMALFAEENGLREYRRLADIIPRRVKPGGHVFLEIGHQQGLPVAEIFAATKAQNIRILPDLAGRDRCVAFHFT